MHARLKLDEAAYFLGEMRRVRDTPQSFAYELSAFLSAARSVDYYLAKKCTGDEAAERWYSDVRSRVKNGEFRHVRYFIDKRDVNVHAGMIEPRGLTKLAISESSTATDSVSVTLRDGQGNVLEQRIQDTAPTAPVERETTVVTRVDTYHFEDRRGEDLFQACQKYLDELTTIVGEAEGILGRPGGGDDKKVV